MKSKVVIKGHPLHPMLIPFPFAFLTGAVLFDFLSWAMGNAAFWTTGGYLIAAGLCTGLLAAVPGAVDYLWVVPPQSSGKKRATQHLACNVGALMLFAIAWFVRDSPERGGAVVFAVEVIGLILLCTAGWLGGTLVYRNQIAVDHRYADAGKWDEKSVETDDDARFALVGKVGDLGVNQMKLLRVGHERIVLGRTEDGYVAFQDHCTHRGGSLADGVMICGTVQCPWHGSQFDVATGKVKSGPAKQPIQAYRVREKDGELRLDRQS
jgi:nitrite reductase/ring-hydroxylating ferredoxin subunit/uncharacterized membrane protein